MFDPNKVNDNKNKREDQKKAIQKLEDWSMNIIPTTIRDRASIVVQEVQCGDPNCAPIDTLISIAFQEGANGMVAVPAEAKDVQLEDLKSIFPTPEILSKWAKGEEAEWPPVEDEVELRFKIGDKVSCLLGQGEWAPGKIAGLWYRDPTWPTRNYAPYQIELDDGRLIFAPADVDQVIRARTGLW
mmetsp:Transcript_15305/g.43130  ORF Transcript_15305/g.43130 Transcript_15305/m.43130 type:complete len:185 (-) Transcript_15305:131-685(-)|eukprot:CAMPEP_0119546148 /NCGR_PEP_ID=MMETSP1352-20130426/685_1 /TAXON_ID=265584 /ORGANISM="Stauroneis constricta, Strain CCMP1120" /LENGTH=184 /DNA_ID=CAMNT_0007590813 /DNA_START=225 /DNA_END=779 /DNA_ORIENTATION=+